MTPSSRTCQEQYGIDFIKKSREIMPFFFFESIQGGLEKTGFKELTEVLFAQFENVNNALVKLCEDIRLRVSFSGQVIGLEAFLNTLFDPEQERITITCLNGDAEFIAIFNNNEERRDELVIFNNGETSTENIALFNNNENPFGVENFDFIINVPQDITTSNDTISAFAKIYVIEVQEFTIQRF